MNSRRPHLLLLLVWCVSYAHGAGREDRVELDARLAAEEAKLRLLESKLEGLESELASLDDRETTLLGELHRLELEIRVSSEELELAKLKLERGYREIDETLARIEALEAEIEELKPYLRGRSVSLYKLGRLSYLRLLLSVREPSELTRAYRYISRLAREDAQKMRRFLRDQEALRETKAELVEQTQRMLQTREGLEVTTRTLERRRANRAVLLEEVHERQEMAVVLMHEMEDARARLGTLVETLSSGIEADAETVYLPMRIFEGEIGWPVRGELGGAFGTEVHPRFQTVTVRNGIEIDAPLGSRVNAVYEGEVVFADWFQGYGRLAILRHPGNVHSLYGYLSDFLVQEGDWISRGDAVGAVGETGSLSGPRLYFEIRVEGQPVNPEKWLDPARKLAMSSN